MERLTRRELWWGSQGETDKAINYKVDEERRCVTHEGSIDFLIADKLAEYEDLEEQGRLLKLPCKVGDTLYSVSYRKKCKEYGELIGGDIECLGCRKDCGTKKEYFIKELKANLAMIGNLIEKPSGFCIFLTRQEAEDKLAEMEWKNGN